MYGILQFSTEVREKWQWTHGSVNNAPGKSRQEFLSEPQTASVIHRKNNKDEHNEGTEASTNRCDFIVIFSLAIVGGLFSAKFRLPLCLLKYENQQIFHLYLSIILTGYTQLLKLII